MYGDASLIQWLFKKDHLQDVAETELDQWLERYPYFSCLYWLKARKAVNDKNALRQAALYAHYPRVLQRYLENTVPEAAGKTPKDAPSQQTPSGSEDQNRVAVPETITKASTAAANPLVLPLYTEDYFAFTRTRLPEHIDNDKPPTMEQVRSFTGWLRMMKRTPPEETSAEEATGKTDPESKDTSLRSREVVTESMAGIWEQHGQPEKAIDIYEKLILLNPEKSTYFAAKIRALKKP